MIQFHALGGLTITDNGREVSLGGPRQRRLVAVLLIHRNTVVSVDRIADAVFAGAPTNAASTTLRSYVARIRRVVDGVDSATVVTQAPGYMLKLQREAFDVACFEHMLADAGSRLTRGDPAAASAELREALALWGGDAYAEFADEDWARPEAQRLEELRIVAHERLVESELACGRATEMIPEIESLAREHELREAFRAQLMIALYRAGRHADALRVFRAYRHVLVEEFGLEPSPAMVELERRVLTHDPRLMLTEPAGSPLRGYRLGERLGTGRDGTVYAARVPGVERDFAIRVIREEIVDRPEFVRSFEPTAHRVASLRHPAIVTIHDYWREPGAAYLVMRRMPGGTLRDRLNRGPLDHATVVGLVLRIGGALMAAAEAGIAHGRLCPESVLFDEAGEPCLGDFALDQRPPVDDASSPSDTDDVYDLARMIGECLPEAGRPIAEVLALGVSTIGRPSISEFVRTLIDVLARQPAEPVLVHPNPYKGLLAFDEADAADFFGRDDLVDDVVARLARDDLQGRLVLVVGGSGTGKSSVVRAGLLPRVRRGDVPGSEHWFVTTMLPGSSPFKELAERLQHVAVAETIGLADQLADGSAGIDAVIRRLVPADGQLLVVVDQLEELFTMASEQDQRGFLDGLMYAVSAPDSRLRVVATLRADFYDRPLAFQRFGAAVNDATVTIVAMSPADLEAAVVEPAGRVGRRVERALVAELVGAVVDEPAALPSLQFTLFELAERSANGPLTLAAYRELGGVEGAIAARAELLYNSLDDAERTAVRQLFERLVVVGAEGEPARRRATRTELSAVVDDTTVDRWSQARLLTLDRHPQTRLPTVELAHEAMLREWPRLRGWIEDGREAIVVRGHLREAAASWVDIGRDEGTLYRGARLQVALDLAEGRLDDLPQLERDFLDASRDVRDREAREAADRAQRQARANRRLRIQLAAIGMALVVALIGGFLAVDQRRDAQRERRVATARELASASEASLADDPERSMLLALAAIEETRSSDGSVLPQAEAALHRAVTTSRVVLSVPGLGGSLAWSPAGDIFVTEGPEESGLVDIRDAETGESVRSFHGHDVDVNAVAFSGDGSMLATTGDGGVARVWNSATGEELWEFAVDDGGEAWAPSFSPDGSRLAASWLNRRLVRVIDLTTGGTIADVESVGDVRSTAFSPDGKRLALANDEPIARVVDTASGTQLFTIGGDEGGIRDVAWSPDGRWLASSGFDGTAHIWDSETLEHRFTVAGHASEVNGLDWSHDSRRLATASTDGTALVWEIAADGARQLLSLSAQSTRNGLLAVEFSPAGDRLMTSDWGIAAVTVFDVSTTGGGEWANLPGIAATRGDRGVSFTSSGQVATSSGGGGTTIWDVERRQRRATIGPPESTADVHHLDVSPSGTLIASGSFDAATVTVWDASTGAAAFDVSGAADGYHSTWDLAWSRDGERLAVLQFGVEGTRVVIVDRSGTQLAAVDEPGFWLTSVNFSPDGRLLATPRRSSERDTPTSTSVRIWDWERGLVVSTIVTPAKKAVFDSTGTRIAAALWNGGVAEVRDIATGERVASLAGHTGTIADIAFSNDGSRVATASSDGTVRLWDPQTGIQQLVLRGDGRGVATVVFSPDGSKLASVGDDGIVRVWALDLDELMAIANERLTRGFTDDECRQFLHVERCRPA